MQDYSQQSPVQTKHERSIGLIYILPIGLLLGVGFFLISRLITGGISFPEATPAASPTPADQLVAAPTRRVSPTESPDPTAAATPERDEIAIMVLNGSGVAGAAGKVATVLEDLGYTDVKTGNAEKYTYTNITLRRAKGQAAAAALVKKDLEKTYTVTEEDASDLEKSVDIEVIIGKTASASSSARATPTDSADE